ncbi:hypothetical protein KR018_007685 [Drosophila ironensis]|nr:hypothetical protein KR018_007685 [Drosophila ironensis]
MIDDKHRMLFQGPDPVGNPDPPHFSVSPNPDGVADPHLYEAPRSASPSEPPTYDDVMSDLPELENYGYLPDRRRTFYVEPSHMRSRWEDRPAGLDQPPYYGRVFLAHNLHTIPEADEPRASTQSPVTAEPSHFVALAPQPRLGTEATEIMCPACGLWGTTVVRRYPNNRTNALSAWLCTLGWCCCACLCPYYINSCLTTSHFCSMCNTFLGSYYPRAVYYC